MQRQAREWVATQRGHSLFRYGYRDETLSYETVSDLNVPDFLVRILGIDVFNPVDTVVFDCDEVTTFAPLTGMTSIQNIHVNIEMADDIDFTPLSELPRLKSLSFTEWSFLTDSQLSELRVLLPHVNIVSEAHADNETEDT